MIKTFKLFMLVCIALSNNMYSQVGINTTDPQTTLDVIGVGTSTTTRDGIIAPRITKQQLAAKSITTYAAAQTGAIVYVTDATLPTGTIPSVAQTIEIISSGYYFFNGNIWKNINSNAQNIYNTNGSLTGTRVVTQGANTLAFTGSAVNAFSIDGTTLSVDATNDRVGVGTAAPRTNLDINGVVSYNEQSVAVSSTIITVSSLAQSALSLTGTGTDNFTINLPPGVSGQRLTIINNTTSGYHATVNTNYKIQASQAVDFIYSNNTWRAIGQSINDNITRMYSGEVIIPPHSAIATNNSYNSTDWKLVSLESGRTTSTTGTYSNTSTIGSQIRSAGKVLVYEYQGKAFDTTKLYPMLTAGNKLSGAFVDADTFTPNFVKLENVGGKTRLTVVLARVDYISGANVGSNANWQGSFFMNVMLIETK